MSIDKDGSTPLKRSRNADWHRTTLGRPSKDPIGRHRRKAKERGVEWGLSQEQYAEALGDGVCHWCKGETFGNGVCLDRIDNSLGYVAGNVIPCCPSCNGDRRTLTYAEYLAVWLVRRMASGAEAQRARSDARKAMAAALGVRNRIVVGAVHHSPWSKWRLPRHFHPREREWREVLAERIAKRDAGLDPDQPWPERRDGESDRELRLRIGTTQKQFAKMLGVGTRTLQRREYGRR